MEKLFIFAAIVLCAIGASYYLLARAFLRDVAPEREDKDYLPARRSWHQILEGAWLRRNRPRRLK